MSILSGRPKIDALAEFLPATRRSNLQRQHVDTTHPSGTKLRHIINDILDVATIDPGRLLLEYIAFDPRQMVGNIIGRHRTAEPDEGSPP